MYKIRRIFESTLVRVMRLVLIVSFVMSGFFFYDFYKVQINKIKGYYWVHQGDVAYKKRDLQRAVNCYEYGIKLHPKHYRAMYNLANIYVAYEDYYSALKNYEKALLVRPDYEVARIDYAIILSETYRTDEAIEQYIKVINNKPIFYKIPFIVDNKKSYYHNKGVAYYNMGIAYRTKSLLAGLNKKTSREYLSKAGESYEEAVDILKTYNSNYNLGLINQLLKNTHQAGYYYCKAMAIEPMEYEAHFNLAVLLKDMEKYPQSAEEFKKAGLILDSISDNVKTRYLYDVLSEVNQRIAITNDEGYFKKLKEDEEKNLSSKYKAGKLIIDLDSKGKDDELLKNFSICEGKEFFMGADE